MMGERQIGLDGAIVFWTMAEWSSRTALIEALNQTGFGAHAPKERTPLSRLQSALRTAFPKDLIRPLKEQHGYEVVREHKGPIRNTYSHVVTVLIGANDKLYTPQDEAYSTSGPALQEVYDAEKDKVSETNVSNTMKKVLEELGSTSLRPTGGTYWLPDKSVPMLQELTALLRQPAYGRHEVYVVRHRNDRDAVFAVLNRFRQEMAREIDELRQRVRDTRSDSRTVASQHGAAEKLRARIKEYEGFLATELNDLHEGLDSVEEDLIESKLAGGVGGGSLFAGVK